MSAPEVEWVLETLASVVANQPADHPLRRVDRDQSRVYETGAELDMAESMRSRKEDLKRSNFVGATYAGFDGTPTGTEFNQNTEHIVGIRIEGLQGSFGHVDPDGVDGVVFSGADANDNPGLVQQIQSALQAKREFPDVDRLNTAYRTLYLENHAPQSAQYRDYHRYDFDVRFAGHEKLP